MSATKLGEFRTRSGRRILLNHPATDDIAKAMRERRPVVRMTLEQANVVFGEPESNSADADETQRVVWCEYGYGKSRSAGRVMSMTEAYDAAQQAALSPSTEGEDSGGSGEGEGRQIVQFRTISSSGTRHTLGFLSCHGWSVMLQQRGSNSTLRLWDNSSNSAHARSRNARRAANFRWTDRSHPIMNSSQLGRDHRA